MEWKTNDSLPSVNAKPRQIIVSAWNETLKSYNYNIVYYHEPLGVWYGGPGILVKNDEIEFWADIPAPNDRK